MFGSLLPRVNATQFATMVTAGYVGVGIFYFPRPLIAHAGLSGLWGLFVDAAVAFGFLKLIFVMARIVPDETLSAYASKLLSKPGGYIAGLYTVIFHLVLAIAAVVVFASVMHNVFLPKTPLWALEALLIVTAGYMAGGGVLALARTLEATYIPVLVLTSLSVAALLSVQHPELYVPSRDVALVPILSGAYHQFFIFIGAEVVVTLSPFIKEHDRKKAERYSYYALIGMTMLLAIQYEMVLGAFGPEVITKMRWPVVSAYRIIAVSGFYIAKVGTLLVVLWSIVIVAFSAVRLWCVAHDFQAFFLPLKGLSYRMSLVIVAALAGLGCFAIPSSKIVGILIEQYLIPLGLIYLIAIPTTVIVAAKLRPRKVLQLRTLSEKKPRGI